MSSIQEDTVRQLYFRKKLREVHVSKNTYVTKQAMEFIREKGMKLIVDDDCQSAAESKTVCSPAKKTLPESKPVYRSENKPVVKPENKPVSKNENQYIRQAAEVNNHRYVTLDNQYLDEKPEYMTHLHSNVLVHKTNPVIAFRGKLDSLEAMVMETQIVAVEEKYTQIADELEEVLIFTRAMLLAEVRGTPMDEMILLGMDEKMIQEISHFPKKYLGVGHLLVNYKMGKTMIYLNKLRTSVRETELSAANAFIHGEQIERPDLLKALNRLSSTFYVMMCRLSANKYIKAE